MLFLDYDGTLTSIVKSPEKAVISQKVRCLLERLSKKRNCKLVIISGRSLEDIKNKIELKNIIYSGNHGLEIKGPKIEFRCPVSNSYRLIFKKIKHDLTRNLSHIKGILFEDKGISFSLHYRSVDRQKMPLVKNIFHETTAPYLVSKKIKVKAGKMVCEVSPPVNWDKGTVVLWLLARQRFLKGNRVFPVYIGDDITDEDAFKALRKVGLTIFVGRPKPSYAQYYLKNTKEVLKFLNQICRRF